MRKEEQLIGEITSGIDKRTLALSTINYVQQQLPAWRDDPKRPHEESEDRLNQQLCKFLDSRARTEFPMVRFNHEEYQSGRYRADLSASPTETTVIGAKQYTIYETILVFECKRLPAPTRDREREYVTGGKERISGGIQRFKLGVHGADMDLVGIIGYLQERSASDWQHDINKWISELSRDKESDICLWYLAEKLELLNEDMGKGLSSYKSSHDRIGKAKNKIKIRHLWITMNVGKWKS